jgi:hypothetical protein
MGTEVNVGPNNQIPATMTLDTTVAIVIPFG